MNNKETSSRHKDGRDDRSTIEVDETMALESIELSTPDSGYDEDPQDFRSTIEVDETMSLEQIELSTAGSDHDENVEADELIDIEKIERESRRKGVVANLGWPVVSDRTNEPEPEPVLGALDEDDEFAPTCIEPMLQLGGADDEQLHMAVEIAELRRLAAAREHALEVEMAAARESIATLQVELSDQIAQVASLTLECSGLRADLDSSPGRRGSRGFGSAEGPMVAVGALGTHAVRDERDAVERLKERLEERSRVIAVVRKEADELRAECTRLRAAAGTAGEQYADRPRSTEGETRWNLRRLFSRVRGEVESSKPKSLTVESIKAEPVEMESIEVEFSDVESIEVAPSEVEPSQAEPADTGPGAADSAAAVAAYAGEPGTEVPTLAVEQPRAAADPVVPPAAAAQTAERAAERARVLQKVRLERRRRSVAHAGAERRGGAAVRPALRRYLIAMDPDRNEVHEILRSRTYIGRGGEADLRIGDATVSRLHSVIAIERGLTIVEDTCSTNGVFINSQQVRRIVLRDGDKVTFGTVRYKYRIGPTPPPELD